MVKQTGTFTKRGLRLIICWFILMVFPVSCAPRGQVFREEALSPDEEGSEQTERSVRLSDTEESAPSELVVHVCGYVRHPGLYKLDAGSRIMQAVEAAGGFKKKADQEAWNLAAPIEDGMQIRIPAKGEKQEENERASEGSALMTSPGSAGEGESGSSPVNINTATVADLIALNGIGEARAKDIVAYREQNGSFHTIEDIKNVSGIGPGIFEKIKDAITV